MNIKIWQLYYDEASLKECKPGFIPKINTETDYKKNPFAENLTILDIYNNEKWQDADMIGCVSWRFFEKTGLSYEDVVGQIDSDTEIYSLSPKKFNDWPHTFLREKIVDERMSAIPGITKIIQAIDRQSILPIKMEGKLFPPSYCNFWVLSPKAFREYITQYLLPVYLFINTSKNGMDLLNYQTKHGTGTLASVLFFLEGLFSVYLYDKKYKQIV